MTTESRAQGPGPLVPGGMFARKFRLEQQMASGAMGFVWRAWDTELEIPVAIKVMAGTIVDSPEYVARFQREARAAAQLRSPHVVNVYEHGVHERVPYIVMELLEGETLGDRLRRQKRLSLQATARVLRDICKALHRAHELGIIHRDLKPANVFLARDVDDDIVKVLDFGVAKLTQGGGGFVTATGELVGTPHFMSPEQIQASKHVDHRADLWSLSVIAFRALTGCLPYNGGIFEVTTQILTGAAPVPSTLAPDLPPAVDAFFARAFAQAIGDRFQSARELSEAINRLASADLPEAGERGPGDPEASADELPTVAMGRPSAGPPRDRSDEAPVSDSSAGTVLMSDRPSAEPSGAAAHEPVLASNARPAPNARPLSPPDPPSDTLAPPLKRRGNRAAVVAIAIVFVLVALGVGLWALTAH